MLRIAVGLLIFALALVANRSVAVAQEYTEGNLRIVNLNVEQFADVGVDDVAFETEFTTDIGDHFRVGFSNIENRTQADYHIVFRE